VRTLDALARMIFLGSQRLSALAGKVDSHAALMPMVIDRAANQKSRNYSVL
jgi:hypothetical protein